MSNVCVFVVGSLIDASARCAIVGTTAWLGVFVLSKLNYGLATVHLRHLVWTLVLTAFVVLPVVRGWLPKWSLPIETGFNMGRIRVGLSVEKPGTTDFTDANVVIARSAQATIDVEGAAVQPTSLVSGARSPDVAPFLQLDGRAADQSRVVEISRGAIPTIVEPNYYHKSASWAMVAVGVWLTGTLVLLLRIALAVIYTKRIVRHAQVAKMRLTEPALQLMKDVSVLESREILAPVVADGWRPRILLPRGWQAWPDGRLRAVLAHEMAHVRRRDLLVGLLAEFAVAIYWFHPLAWFVRRQLSRLAELACDEAAVVATGNKLDYAQHLIEIASLHCVNVRGLQPGIAMARASQVDERVSALVSRSIPPQSAISRTAFTSTLLIAVPTLLAIAVAQPSDAQQPLENAATANDTRTKIQSYSIDQWLIENDGEVKLRIHGQVLMPDGSSPTTEIEIKASAPNEFESDVVVTTKTNGRFQLDVANSVTLITQTKDGKFQAYKQLGSSDLRAVAQRDLIIKLQPARQVTTRVVDDAGQPVVGADAMLRVGFEHDARARSDVKGMATFLVPSGARLDGFAAWTNDHRIGGWQFHQEKISDEANGPFEVKLAKSKPQKIRITDVDGKPLASLPVVLHIANPRNFSYIPVNPKQRLLSTVDGEIQCNWFPDWENVHYYIEFDRRQWFQVSDMKLGQVKFYQLDRMKKREPFTGQVLCSDGDAAGLLVDISSFQHEQANRSDQQQVWTDRQGRYSLPVQPGATYVVHISDSEYVSEPWHGILIPDREARSEAQVTQACRGVPMKIHVTRGELAEAVVGQLVSVSKDYSYSWLEANRVKKGMNSARWSATTDQNGWANISVLPGKLDVRVFANEWTFADTFDVVEGKENAVSIRRPAIKTRQLRGRLVLANVSDVDLKDTEIRLNSAVPEQPFSATVRCDSNGQFNVDVRVNRLVAYARTLDGKAAGWSLIELTEEPTSIQLKPTAPFRVQVLDKDDNPLTNAVVSLSAWVSGESDSSAARYNLGIRVGPFSARTDSNGFAEVTGVPLDVRLILSVTARHSSSDQEHYLGERLLRLDENRPTEVIRLDPTKRSQAPNKKASTQKTFDLKTRHVSLLHDCRLSHANLLVILAAQSEHANRLKLFALDYDKNFTAGAYLPLVIEGQLNNDAIRELETITSERILADQRGLTLIAQDANGTLLGRLEVSVDQFEEASRQIMEFINAHAPERQNAKQKWEKALVDAKRTGRRVWVRNSQTRCAPCFAIARWLDQHREILEKDYVMVKIDNVLDLHGSEIVNLIGAEQHGIPYHAIYDAGGKKLIDSIGPLGNIGHPSTFEGINHLRRMISQTAINLRQSEIDGLVESLDDRRR